MANPVVHFEIMVKEGGDLEGVRSFYANVFGWKIDANNPMNYGLVDTGEGIGGGIGKPMMGPSYATFYIQVDDLAAALRTIEARGGRAIMQPMDVPGQPVSIAMFADPADNLIGLVKNRS